MTFKDSYVSGEFLARLYDSLYNSRSIIRSDLYDVPCSFSKDDFQIDLFILLLEMEDLAHEI